MNKEKDVNILVHISHATDAEKQIYKVSALL